MTAYSGVLEALIARGISGRGQGLSVSLFDAIADWMTVPLLLREATGREPGRPGLAHPSICPYGAFRLADGEKILIAIQNEREWVKFCVAVLQAPDLPLGCALRLQCCPGRQSGFYRGACCADPGRADPRRGAIAIAPLPARPMGSCATLPAWRTHPALRRQDVASANGPVSLVAPPVRRAEPAALGPVPALGEHSDPVARGVPAMNPTPAARASAPLAAPGEQTRAFLSQPRCLHIAGEWMEGHGSDIEVVNPADEQILTTLRTASTEQLDDAVAAARAALHGAWGRASGRERAMVLAGFADLLETHAQFISEVMTLDNGSPLSSSCMVVRFLAADVFRYYAGWATKISGESFSPSLGARPEPGHSRQPPCANRWEWSAPSSRGMHRPA